MLVGSWTITCRCAEIEHIDSDVEVYKHSHLHELADDRDTWETLYGCPETGRLWRAYRVHPEYHGGGWPKLVQVSPEEAKSKFGWDPAPNERLRAIRAAPEGGQAYVDRVRHTQSEFQSAGVEIEDIDWNSSRWWRSLWRIGIERENIRLDGGTSEMPPRNPRPKRAQVKALRDDYIKSYRSRLQECLTPPPAPLAVVVRIKLAAGGAKKVGLCQAWLSEARAARAHLTHACTLYHQLYTLPQRADDPEVRAQARWSTRVSDPQDALHCLALAGSSRQRQDCSTLIQQFNEPQSDRHPVERLYICTLRDLVAGDDAGCRHWAEQASQLGRAGETWAIYVQGIVACRAIVDGDAGTLSAALQVVLSEQFRETRAVARLEPGDLLSLQGTALVALAQERGLAVDLEAPHGEYIARCLLPRPGWRQRIRSVAGIPALFRKSRG